MITEEKTEMANSLSKLGQKQYPQFILQRNCDHRWHRRNFFAAEIKKVMREVIFVLKNVNIIPVTITRPMYDDFVPAYYRRAGLLKITALAKMAIRKQLSLAPELIRLRSFEKPAFGLRQYLDFYALHRLAINNLSIIQRETSLTSEE